MGKGFDIHWDGLIELTTTISNAHSKAVEQSQKVLKNNTEEMKVKAREYAPKDTWFMHDQIYSNFYGMNGEIVSPAVYSGFVEYGTRKMGAKPFMRPALHDQRPKFEKDLTDVMKGAFK